MFSTGAYAITMNRYVRAHTFTCWKFDRHGTEQNGQHQTKVTMYQRPDLGGVIPHQFVNSLAQRQLMAISRMRERFDRSEEINNLENESILKYISGVSNETSSNGSNDGFSYNSSELALLEEGEKELAKSEHYNEMELLHRMSPMISLSSDSNNNWMMAKVRVHASAEQFLAHLWNF